MCLRSGGRMRRRCVRCAAMGTLVSGQAQAVKCLLGVGAVAFWPAVLRRGPKALLIVCAFSALAEACHLCCACLQRSPTRSCSATAATWQCTRPATTYPSCQKVSRPVVPAFTVLFVFCLHSPNGSPARLLPPWSCRAVFHT